MEVFMENLTKPVEYRFDDDGYVYSKEEFRSFYNGTSEWKQAEYSHTWIPKECSKQNKKLVKQVKKDKKYIEDMYDEIQEMTHELESSLDKISEFRSNFEENLDIKLEDIYKKYDQVQNKLDMLDENMNGEV